MGHVLPLLLIGSYIVILLFLAVVDARRGSSARYMIGARSVRWFPAMASITGNLRDGAGIAAWVVLGIAFGLGALWLTVGLVIGLAILGFVAPHIRRLAGEKDIITASQLVDLYLGGRTARLVTFAIAGTAFLYAAAQVHVSGRVMAGVLNITPTLGIIGVAAVVAIYLVAGGFISTVRTGVVQWVFLMLILIFPWMLRGGRGSDVPLETITSPGWEMGGAFVGISLLVVLSSADLWQLLFSSSSSRDAQRAFYLSIPVYILISLGMVFFAVGVYHVVGYETDPGDALFALFREDVLPDFARALIGLFVAAAVMSTLDSQVFLFASTLVREAMPSRVSSEDPRIETATRALVIALMAVLVIIALRISDLVEFLFGAVTLATVIVPILLVASSPRIARPTLDLPLSLSLLVSMGLYVALFIGGAFSNLVMTLLPASASIALCLLAILWERARRRSNA